MGSATKLAAAARAKTIGWIDAGADGRGGLA